MTLLLTEAPTNEADVYRVSVGQFVRMAEDGFFPPGSRIELLNGVLLNMSPIGAGHFIVLATLDELLQRQLRGRAVVGVQSSLLLDERSLPQPDLVVLRGPRSRYYHRQRPTAEDALLVIEVADSSLEYDQRAKLVHYASQQIPEYWVVDLPHQVVHVYTDPKGNGYATSTTYTKDDTLVVPSFPDVEVPVSELDLDKQG